MRTTPVIDHTAKGRARSIPELAYAVALTPCPACSWRSDPRLKFATAAGATILVVDCGRCGARREEKFSTDGDLTGAPYPRLQLGSEAPSEIITPRQFADEVDRLVALVGDPTKLLGAAHLSSSTAAWDAVTPAYELEKFSDDRIVLPVAWPQAGTNRQTVAMRRDMLIAVAQQHLETRSAAMERGLASALALGSPASAYPPSIAFRLAVEAGALGGVDDALALCAALAGESEPKLAHAVGFGSKAAEIRRAQLLATVSLGLAAAEGSGVAVAPLPTGSSGWTAWRDAMRAASAPRVNALGARALEVVDAVFDLERTRQYLQRIAYLRASAPEHHALAEEAERTRHTSELARARLVDTLEWFRVFSALDGAREKLKSWADRESYEAATGRMRLEDLPMQYRIEQDGRLREIFAKIADNLSFSSSRLPNDRPVTNPGATPVRQRTKLSIEVDDFIANAPRLFADDPITTVHLRGTLVGRGEALAGVVELARVTYLGMGKLGVSDDDLIALLRSPHLRSLRTLDLTENAITARGIDALAAATATHLPALESVGLQLNKARDPTDQLEYVDETTEVARETEAGQALEAKYGRLRWLHPHD